MSCVIGKWGTSMKNWLSLKALLACGLLACSMALTAPALAAKRVALVIGNNDYKNVPKLQKAVNDARTMGDTLKQLGFTVMLAENQNRQQFSQTLLAFDNAVEAGDTAFFFYAGHGFEIAGQNFLLPTDVPAATEGQEELVRDASILADRIIDRLSNDDVNPNSVFTRTFSKELLQPGENLVQVAQHTRRLVSEMAETVKHKQIPVYFDQMVDDVFLNGATKGQAEAAKSAEPPQKVAALPPVSVPRLPKEDSVNAPIAAFSRHNGGWTITFSIADPTLGISWRMGDNGDFRETG